MFCIGKLRCFNKDENFVLKERKVSTNEIFQQMNSPEKKEQVD